MDIDYEDDRRRHILRDIGRAGRAGEGQQQGGEIQA